MGTKIIYTKNKIIFDGHCDTKEECENITLLCNNLSNSKDYKTIKYESGYAEFEKVGKSNELKFVRGPGSIDLYDSVSNTRILGVSSDASPVEITFTGKVVTFTITGGSLMIDYANNDYVDTYDTNSGLTTTATFKQTIKSIDDYKVTFATTPTTKLIKIKFKDILTFTTSATYTLNFTSNGNNYTSLTTYWNSNKQQRDMKYGANDVVESGTWLNDNFKVIEIDSTQTNFQSFITAMKDNIEGVELESGTYKWVNNPNTNNIEFDVTECSLNFSSNNQSCFQKVPFW